MSNEKFKAVVEAILTKHNVVSLQKRWEEAISFGTGANASAYWIRDTEDLINIVWLSSDSIRDITWFPSGNQSVFNFIPLRNIVAIEVRDGADIAKQFGYGVEGNLIIRTFCSATSGVLAWVSSTEKQEQDLRTFVNQVFKAYTEAITKEQHSK